jgi:MFS family permease
VSEPFIARSDRAGWGEFGNNKLLLLSAFIGLTTSMNAVMIYSLGSFIDPLNEQFGWDRSSISLAVSVLTLGVFLGGPIVGRLADRFGAAAVGALSLLAYGLVVLTMSLTLVSFASFLIAYFLIALAGVGSTPIVLLRPITSGFDVRRGIALGIALTGAGLAGTWVPIAVTEATAAFGWQAGYWVIAASAIGAAPVVWFGFGPNERRLKATGAKASDEPGLTFPEARRTPAFWLATALAFCMALGIGGLIVHLIPFFKDLGADARTAARFASVVGVSSAIGRLLIGFALDRFPSRLVTTLVLALGAAGVALLSLGGMATGALAVALIGLLLGAELDLLAYLSSRRFGQKAFGAIYGWLYSIYSLGFGLSPFLIGLSRDHFGHYDVAVIISVSLLAIAALAAQGLRPTHISDYPRP